MTDQEKNIAIAETQGYRFYDEHITKPDGTEVDCEFLTEDGVNEVYPDYCHDLNEMDKVEESLHGLDWAQYFNWLQYYGRATGVRATAEQRSEGFLRIKGLWKESQQACKQT
jgi:hypothetical protein